MAHRWTQVQSLARAFFTRFFDNELTGGGEDLKTSVFTLVALLATPGVILPMLLGQGNLVDPRANAQPVSDWGWSMVARFLGPEALRTISLPDKTLYLACAIGVTAILTALVWTSLLPSRRDVQVLGPLPVSAFTVVSARLAALTGYVGLIALAMHALASLSFGAFLAAGSSFGFALRGSIAHLVASCAASAFVCFAVAGAQGLLLAIAGPRRFARLSFLLQAALIALVVGLLLSLPAMRNAVIATLGRGPGEAHGWILLTPPLWFLGLYEVVLGARDPILVGLMRTAVLAVGASVLVTVATYAATYRRLSASAIEQAEPRRTRLGSRAVRALARALSRDPHVQAVAEFFVLTIARVDRHRMVMAAAAGLTLAWTGAAWLQGAPTSSGAPPIAWLTMPFSALIFLLSGLRLAAALPADAAPAWLFDVMPPTAAQTRRAVERVMLALIVAPILLTSTLLMGAKWGARYGATHAALFTSVSALALEILLSRLRAVPCTQPWQPERANIRKLWPLYLGGFVAFTSLAGTLDAGLWLIVVKPGPLAGLGFRIAVPAVLIGIVLGAAVLVRRAALAELNQSTDTNIDILADALRSGSESRRADESVSRELPAVRPRPSLFRSFGMTSPATQDEPWFDEWRVRPAQLLRDVRFAWRRLRTAPAFTAFAVGTLALGIGATTTIYTLERALFARPLDVRDPASLLVVASDNRLRHGVSWLDFQDLRDSARAFTSLDAWTTAPASLTGRDRTLVVETSLVTESYFQTLGIDAAIGRVLQPADGAPDAPPAAVLADATWRSRFGADRRVIGTPVRIGDTSYTVVGVLPSSFRGLNTARRVPAVWLPLSHAPLTDAAVAAHRDATRRDQGYLDVVGRLRRGTSGNAARSEIASLAASLDRIAPLPQVGGFPRSQSRSWTTNSLDAGSRVVGTAWPTIAMLLLPALVLLVACTNIANLVLSRGAARRGDIAIRRALGASRWSVIREQVIEHGLVALAGGAVAVVLARAGVVYVNDFVQQALGYAPQYQMDPRVDTAVMVAVFAAVGLAVVVAGLAPAIQLTRGGVTRVISPDVAAASPRWRGRARLIAAQVAASVALLLVAALCVRAALAAGTAEHGGTDLSRVGAMRLALGLRTHDAAEATALASALADAAHRDPSLIAAAVLSDLPGGGRPVTVTTADRPFDPGAGSRTPDDGSASLVAMTPDAFRAAGLAFLSGRGFDGTETAASARVAVVSDALARHLVGDAPIVGRDVLLRVPMTTGDPRIDTVSIVGVVPSASVDAKGRPEHEVYVPFAQRPAVDLAYLDEGVLLMARANSGSASTAVESLWRVVKGVDPDLAVDYAGPASRVGRFGASIGILALLARIAATLATIALTLSMTGLYGVVSHVVAGRGRELGIRLALGASRRHILEMVFTDAARPVLYGLGVGLIMAAIARLSLQPYFRGTVSALDWAAIVLAVIPLIVAAAVACYLPARRAARTDPNVALREL